MARVVIAENDAILSRYANQIGALGTGKARMAFARAINRTTTTAHGRVIRALGKQISLPQRIIRRSVSRTLTSTKGNGTLEGRITAVGGPISLKYFKARQFSFGVKAFVQGSWRQYQSAFMGPRPGVIAPRLNGHVFVRTSAARFPIEMLFGPAIPDELIRGESVRVFEHTVATMLPNRVSHELGRLLPN